MNGNFKIEYLIANSFTAFLLFIGSVLYSSVGHGGASAYIAILALTGTPIGIIKPIGLILNIVVSSIASFRFIKNKLFSLKVLMPVVSGSIPAAFVGGYISLPSEFYKPLVGLILIFAGPMTVIPLFLYVRGVELCGLGPTGMIFYITPTFQFILGFFYYNEPFSLIKLVSFILIWIAVFIYLKDLYENN